LIKLSSDLITRDVAATKKQTPFERRPEKATRILLVEDDSLAASMVMRLFREMNCEITHAMDGVSALQHVADRVFDFILMDLGLPDQSGFDVAHSIRNRLDSPNIKTPIIALTGHMFSDKHKECLAAGMQDMLTKPLTALKGQQLLITYVEKEVVVPTVKRQKSIVELSVIDLEDGMNILDGDLKAAKEALNLLAQSLPRDLQKIQKSYQDHHYEELYQSIHKLYGGLCYCGTPRLREVSQLLRQALIDKKEQKLPTLMKRLVDEVECFLQTHQNLDSSD